MLRQNYDEELENMRRDILRMGDLSIQMFDLCTNIFQSGPDTAARLSEMEKQQDRIEKKIEETATRLITLQQPVAKDTREVVCAVRIATNWRKISSHITDISEYSETCPEKVRQNPEEREIINRITAAAADMMRDALSAYETRNAEEAVRTAGTDDEIDALFWKIRTELMTEGTEGKALSLCALMIAEHIERIGDHAANICEEIVYLEKYELVKLN